MQIDQDEQWMDSNAVIEKRKQVKEHYRFLTSKKRMFLLAIVLSLILIFVYYFLSNQSNINLINIKGNDYLSDAYIKEIAQIDEDDKYFLVFNHKVEKNLLESPFIKKVEVKHKKFNIIDIDLEVNRVVGYQMNPEFEILLASGELVKSTDDLVNIISEVPLIRGYNEDSMKFVGQYLNDVDEYIVNNISDITRYPMSYDENMAHVLMRDGNSLFTSYFAFSALNNYYDILPMIEETNACIYIDEITKVAYSSKCPWNDDIIKDDKNENTNTNE